MTDSANDLFFDAYDRDEIAYGLTPSASLAAFLDQFGKDQTYVSGKALDLGAGAGRDTLAIAAAGFDVTSVDISGRGLERVLERAKRMGVEDRVATVVSDVRQFDMPAEQYDLVIGTTVLDHIPAEDSKSVWRSMAGAIGPRGVLFVEVHTTEDPGSGQVPGCDRDDPVSETAGAVINYFRPNQLAAWALEPDANLRILKYEERLEWDYSHGPEHLHGKAILLAVRSGYHPDWFGQPAAFPKQ